MIIEKKQMLKKRAERLAQSVEEQKIKDGIQVLVFQLAQEQYAIETKYIKEVCSYKTYTILPGTPNFLFGLINIRRRILSVLDLKVLFALPSGESSDNQVVIIEDNEIEFAVLIDQMIGVLTISPDQLQMSLPTLTGIRQELFKGVTHGPIIILDGSKLLNSKQLIVNEEVEI